MEENKSVLEKSIRRLAKVDLFWGVVGFAFHIIAIILIMINYRRLLQIDTVSVVVWILILLVFITRVLVFIAAVQIIKVVHLTTPDPLIVMDRYGRWINLNIYAALFFGGNFISLTYNIGLVCVARSIQDDLEFFQENGFEQNGEKDKTLGKRVATRILGLCFWCCIDGLTS